MVVDIEKAKKDIQVFYRKVFSVMCEYREKHHGELCGDYPLDEFYSKIWTTEEEYETWRKYKFVREDVSDEYYDSEPDKESFKKREKFRRLSGLWVPPPSFMKMNM